MVQSVGLEKELKEHLALWFTKLLATMDHLGALGAPLELNSPRFMQQCITDYHLVLSS